MIHIKFDDVIFKLLCCYAFSIPFEKVLEVFFDIETIFKPYRVFALLLVFVFGVKCLYKFKDNPEIKSDIFLYLIFAYGLVVSAIKMMTTPFNMSLFYNDIFQIGLYLAVFVVIRHSNLSMRHLHQISVFLGIGIFLNALYIFNNFFILRNFRRESGFMDNPNYLAFSVVVLILFMITHRSKEQTTRRKIFWWGLLLFMGYTLLISGSRTGIVVLLISGLVLMIISPYRHKWRLMTLGIVISGILGLRSTLYPNTVGPLIALNRITQKETSDDPRIPMWTGIIKSAQDTNFVGLGIGQFKANFRTFFYEENNSLIKKMISRGYFLSPHSDYFALLIIYGIFGLGCYLIFLFKNGQKLLSKLYYTNGEDQLIYWRYAFSIFIAFTVFGIAAENFSSPIYWLVLSISTKTHFS